MTCELTTALLADEQKGQICGILSVGCDRETAANFVGCSIADIGRAMRLDPAFASSILRTEAGAELSHMSNVQQAAKEAKNWRASIWWLERHSPERFGPRGAGEVTVRQLRAFIDTLVGILSDEIHVEEDRRRVTAKLGQAISTLGQLIHSAMPGAAATFSESPSQDSDTTGDFEPADSLETPANT